MAEETFRSGSVGTASAEEEGSLPATARYDALDAVPAGFGRAFAAAEGSSVFFAREWFENLHATVGGGQPRVFAAAPGGDAPPALLPMLEGPRTALRPRRLRALSNYYTSLFGPVVDYDAPGAARSIDALVGALVDDRPRWDVIDLHPLEHGMATDTLARAFRRRGWLVQEYFCFGNWYEPVAGLSLEDYVAARPSQLRNTLRRKRKKFDREEGARIEIVTGGDGLERALEGFQQAYSLSWKRPEPYPDFIPGLVRACAARGWLRLGCAWIGDRIAASQLWIVCHGIANIYKLAYDPAFQALSPGSLLTLDLMQQALEVDRVREADYLTGDDPYKKDWMTQRRERWGLVAFNTRPPRGLLSAARHLGARSVRRLLGRPSSDT